MDLKPRNQAIDNFDSGAKIHDPIPHSFTKVCFNYGTKKEFSLSVTMKLADILMEKMAHWERWWLINDNPDSLIFHSPKFFN